MITILPDKALDFKITYHKYSIKITILPKIDWFITCFWLTRRLFVMNLEKTVTFLDWEVVIPIKKIFIK